MNAPPRPQLSAQQSISREQLLALIETPDPFIAWLRRYTPDVEVASIFDPVHSMLAEYFWATLEVDTMYGDSIVWSDGVIEWHDLPSLGAFSQPGRITPRGDGPRRQRYVVGERGT